MESQIQYTSEERVLVAVSVASMKSEPYLGPDMRLCHRAVIRGESNRRDASFTFQTGLLNAEQVQRCQELERHGFTVVEAPSDWQYAYHNRPGGWQEVVIQRAMKQVALLYDGSEGSEPMSAYDAELATGVLRELDKRFPYGMTNSELKHTFDREPSDDALLTALDALNLEGLISGQGLRDHTTGRRSLVAMANIKISGEGRRSLQDEMRRKTAKPKQAFRVNDVSAVILTQLLSEFRELKLTAEDLRNTYQGLAPMELKQRCIDEGISEVDFDLAMIDLENHDLVKTGPLALYDNPPNSSVTIISFYSKNEYSFLTVDGYKEAAKAASITPTVPRSSASPSHAVIHGDQIINYGQAGALGRYATGTINYQQQWAEIESQTNLQELAIELGQLRTRLQQTATSRSDFQRLGLLAEAEEQAEKQAGSKVLETLSKVGKGLVEFAKEVGSDLTAKVIAKSMGLEP